MSIKHTAEQITYLAAKIGNLAETEEDAKKFILHEINCLAQDLIKSLNLFESEKIIFLQRQIKTLESNLSQCLRQNYRLQAKIDTKVKEIELKKSQIKDYQRFISSHSEIQDKCRFYNGRINELNAQVCRLNKKLSEAKYNALDRKLVDKAELYQSVLVEKSKSLTEYMSNAYGDAPPSEPLASKHEVPPCPPKRDNTVLGSQSVAEVSSVEGTGVVSPMSDCRKKRSRLFDW